MLSVATHPDKFIFLTHRNIHLMLLWILKLRQIMWVYLFLFLIQMFLYWKSDLYPAHEWEGMILTLTLEKVFCLPNIYIWQNTLDDVFGYTNFCFIHCVLPQSDPRGLSIHEFSALFLCWYLLLCLPCVRLTFRKTLKSRLRSRGCQRDTSLLPAHLSKQEKEPTNQRMPRQGIGWIKVASKSLPHHFIRAWMNERLWALVRSPWQRPASWTYIHRHQWLSGWHYLFNDLSTFYLQNGNWAWKVLEKCPGEVEIRALPFFGLCRVRVQPCLSAFNTFEELDKDAVPMLSTKR